MTQRMPYRIQPKGHKSGSRERHGSAGRASTTWHRIRMEIRPMRRICSLYAKEVINRILCELMSGREASRTSPASLASRNQKNTS